jgi:hypothetical protein
VSDEQPKTFWAKLGVLATFLAAVSGLGAALHECSKSGDQQPTVRYEAPPAASPVSQPIGARYCCGIDNLPHCPLISPLPAGSSCFCPGQGMGYSCG